MRGSVVFLAVFAVTSCSGAHFVKSGITGYGTGRGNGNAPGIGESDFGYGENDGHHIGKRSNLGHDIAKQAAFRSAAARKQRMIDDILFPEPILRPPFLTSLPPLPAEEYPPLGPTDPIFTPPLFRKLWNNSPMVKSRDLPLRRAMPSVLEREVQTLPALDFLQLPPIETISNLPDTPVIFPVPSAARYFARGQNFHRSDLKNRRSRYSGLRGYSPLRSYQTLPGPVPDDFVAMPGYKLASNTAPAQPGTEDKFRMEVRSAVVRYLIQLWDNISQWFRPGSHSGGCTEGVPPKEKFPAGVGKEAEPGLPVEHEVHTERPPEEYQDDVIIEPVTPPVNDDDVEIIHLLSEEDAPETGEDSIGEGGTVGDEDYFEPVQFKPQHQTNWEIHSNKRTRLFNKLGKKSDSSIDFQEDNYVPRWGGPMTLAKSMRYSNWEARRSTGKEDVAGKIKGTSAGTRSKNTRDDLGTVTDIFGRRAVD